jgi:uncharacterized protein (TIGR02996 family)
MASENRTTDEAPFLAAIQADPDDQAPRLIYADWLEERGDPRGELIRIEEEMRALPVFSDRYWQLKPRRNELREHTPPDWLEGMRYGIDCHTRYGIDCQPLFRHGFPDGWRERWRLIREYMDRWYGLSLPDVGGRAEEIRAVEARLGRPLPPSVREWVAFAHDVRRRPDDDQVFTDLYYQMCELEGLSAVSLLIRSDEGVHWAVRHADLNLPDPPVYVFVRSDEDWDTFVPYRDNPIDPALTVFVLKWAVGKTHTGWVDLELPDPAELIRDLAKTFRGHCRLEKFNNYHERRDVEIFDSGNILVRLSPPFQPGEEVWDIRFNLASELPREAIPAFLLKHILDYPLTFSESAGEGENTPT